jgi:hypothetical protein
MSYLSHPTGMAISIIITILLIFYNRSFFQLFLYMLGLLLSVGPYMAYILLNFQEYARQMGLIFKEFYYAQPIFLNILDEIPVRYFGLPPVRNIFNNIWVDGRLVNRYIYDLNWLISNVNLNIYFARMSGQIILFASFAALIIKKFKTKSEFFLLFIISVFIISMSVHPNKFPAYLYEMVPYFGICLSLPTDRLIAGFSARGMKPDMFKTIFFAMILILYFSANAAFIYKDLSSGKRQPYAGFIEKVKSYIPPGSSVAGPIYFWPGLYKDYSYISVNQIMYEADKILRDEKNGLRFEKLTFAGQEELIGTILSRHGIEYMLLTCHRLDELTEAPGLAKEMGEGIRSYLTNHTEKRADFLRANYYKDLPEAGRFEEEVYYPSGATFDNPASEYQNSLKIYKIKLR